MAVNWADYPNFDEIEFRCRHTDLCVMDPSFLAALQALRGAIGQPFHISSGYRHPSHPAEARKKTPGAHAAGCAADILCHGQLAYRIVAAAPRFGFRRIGVSQKGPTENRFIHLDTWAAFPACTIWSY